MTGKHWLWLAGALRCISYLLVFYAGLEIGVKSGNTGLSPIFALFGAIVFGAAASATASVVHEYGA